METALLIYLYFTVGKLLATSLIASFVIVGCTGFAFIVASECSKEDWYKRLFTKITKPALIVGVVTILLNGFYPDKGVIKYMIGGTAIVAASKLEGVEKLPKNIIDLANAFLEETTEDITND